MHELMMMMMLVDSKRDFKMNFNEIKCEERERDIKMSNALISCKQEFNAIIYGIWCENCIKWRVKKRFALFAQCRTLVTDTVAHPFIKRVCRKSKTYWIIHRSVSVLITLITKHTRGTRASLPSNRNENIVRIQWYQSANRKGTVLINEWNIFNQSVNCMRIAHGT